MKELRAPWINWHSPDANILPTAFAKNDPLLTHPWFTQKEPQGALVCEAAVARPSISRWVRARFDALTTGGGAIQNPARIIQQILDTPTGLQAIRSPSEQRALTASICRGDIFRRLGGAD